MKQEITAQIASAAASPKVATVVASVTAGSGLASMFDIISSGLGLVAVTSGIILTSILIRKHLYEYKMMKVRDQEQRGRREEDESRPG